MLLAFLQTRRKTARQLPTNERRMTRLRRRSRTARTSLERRQTRSLPRSQPRARRSQSPRRIKTQRRNQRARRSLPAKPRRSQPARQNLLQTSPQLALRPRRNDQSTGLDFNELHKHALACSLGHVQINRLCQLDLIITLT